MGRILLTLLLAGVLAGVAGWYLGAFTQLPDDPGSQAAGDGGQRPVNPKELGEPLYPPVKMDTRGLQHAVPGGSDSIVIQGNLREIDKVDIPSQVPGQILYIGDGVPEGVMQVAGIAPFMHDSYKQAKVVHKDRFVTALYRPWKEGQIVTHGQELGKVDYSRSHNAVLGHLAILERAKTEIAASKEMEYAANELHKMTRKLRATSPIARRCPELSCHFVEFRATSPIASLSNPNIH